jgi:hypothetical protein
MLDLTSGCCRLTLSLWPGMHSSVYWVSSINGTMIFQCNKMRIVVAVCPFVANEQIGVANWRCQVARH